MNFYQQLNTPLNQTARNKELCEFAVQVINQCSHRIRCCLHFLELDLQVSPLLHMFKEFNIIRLS